MKTSRSEAADSRPLLSLYDQVSLCVLGLEDRLARLTGDDASNADWPDEPDYADARRRRTRLPKLSSRRRVHAHFPSQPGHRGLISRSKDGKFVLNEDDYDDEGGFGQELPPNRFRTRSVAIVAGYSPERLYSNMPPGGFCRRKRNVPGGRRAIDR